MCVPSTLHQQLMFWNEGKVEVVPTDQKPFSADVKIIEAMYYTLKFQPITWPPGINQDAIQAVNFTNQGFKVEINGDYLENLLSNMLNDNDLSNELQDDSIAIATVGISPMEFDDQDGNFWYLEGDVMVDGAECEALVPTTPREIKFEKWTRAGHLRPLYITAQMNEKPINRVLVDRGAVFNIMPYSTVEKFGKSHKDLKKINMTLSSFTRESTLALGFLIAELTVGSRTNNTLFFVVDSRLGYTILLRREWIHANQCVPSTLHQQLQFWNGDWVEVVDADPFPFTADVRMQDAMLYSPKIEPIAWPEDVPLDLVKSLTYHWMGLRL